MDCLNILKSGNKVLISDNGKEYTTLIDEILDDANFSILQPFYKGKAIELTPGKEYKFTCMKGGGLHFFNVIAIRSGLSGHINVTYVRYTGNYFRLQRRNAFRVRAQLDVQIRKLHQAGDTQAEWCHAKTLDISESGMRVRLEPGFGKGDIVECVVTIAQCDIFATLPLITGEIRRTSLLQNRANESICGVEFTEIDAKAQNLILKLVMRAQRDPFVR